MPTLWPRNIRDDKDSSLCFQLRVEIPKTHKKRQKKDILSRNLSQENLNLNIKNFLLSDHNFTKILYE